MFFINQEAGVALFEKLLGIKPNSDHEVWRKAGGWSGREAIVIMSDEDGGTTMTAATLVLFPHSGSPGRLNLTGGHFDVYLKDSTQLSEPSKMVLGYQATAKKAYDTAKAKSVKVRPGGGGRSTDELCIH